MRPAASRSTPLGDRVRGGHKSKRRARAVGPHPVRKTVTAPHHRTAGAFSRPLLLWCPGADCRNRAKSSAYGRVRQLNFPPRSKVSQHGMSHLSAPRRHIHLLNQGEKMSSFTDMRQSRLPKWRAIVVIERTGLLDRQGIDRELQPRRVRLRSNPYQCPLPGF